MEETLVMTVADVQRELKIGKNKTYLLFKQRSFPSFRLDGTWLVTRKDFLAWLDRLHGKNIILDPNSVK